MVVVFMVYATVLLCWCVFSFWRLQRTKLEKVVVYVRKVTSGIGDWMATPTKASKDP